MNNIFIVIAILSLVGCADNNANSPPPQTPAKQGESNLSPCQQEVGKVVSESSDLALIEAHRAAEEARAAAKEAYERALKAYDDYQKDHKP